MEDEREQALERRNKYLVEEKDSRFSQRKGKTESH